MKEFGIKFLLSHTKHSAQVTLHNLHSPVSLNHRPTRATRFSPPVTLNRPTNLCHLQIIKRSFYHTASAMWNTLPSELRQLAHADSTMPLVLLSPPLYLFHRKLKTPTFRFSFALNLYMA